MYNYHCLHYNKVNPEIFKECWLIMNHPRQSSSLSSLSLSVINDKKNTLTEASWTDALLHHCSIFKTEDSTSLRRLVYVDCSWLLHCWSWLWKCWWFVIPSLGYCYCYCYRKCWWFVIPSLVPREIIWNILIIWKCWWFVIPSLAPREMRAMVQDTALGFPGWGGCSCSTTSPLLLSFLLS